jgi:hypothetical protein
MNRSLYLYDLDVLYFSKKRLDFMGFGMIFMGSMRLIFKYFFLERIDLTL